MIMLNYRGLKDFAFREFVAQLLPYLVGREFSISCLAYVDNDAGMKIYFY